VLVNTRVGLVAFTAIALALPACGTFASFPKVYGGTRDDADRIESGGSGFVRVPTWFFVVDLPFSFIFDTVFLPATVTAAIVGTDPADRPSAPGATVVRAFNGGFPSRARASRAARGPVSKRSSESSSTASATPSWRSLPTPSSACSARTGS
jgi:uncharacterized protein YceK